MNTYRINTIGPNGYLARSEVAECANDEAVVQKALGEANGSVIEIWDHKRFVARLPGATLEEK
jgi:hypothetical protein